MVAPGCAGRLSIVSTDTGHHNSDEYVSWTPRDVPSNIPEPMPAAEIHPEIPDVIFSCFGNSDSHFDYPPTAGSDGALPRQNFTPELARAAPAPVTVRRMLYGRYIIGCLLKTCQTTPLSLMIWEAYAVHIFFWHPNSFF